MRGPRQDSDGFVEVFAREVFVVQGKPPISKPALIFRIVPHATRLQPRNVKRENSGMGSAPIFCPEKKKLIEDFSAAVSALFGCNRQKWRQLRGATDFSLRLS
jgi:hypothetical protein